jgi:hypothetical protein
MEICPSTIPLASTIIPPESPTGARQNSSFVLAGTTRRAVRAWQRDAPASEESFSKSSETGHLSVEEPEQTVRCV